MGKKLLEKAALALTPRNPGLASIHPPIKDEDVKPKTAIGGMAQFTDRQSHAVKEAAQLKNQLKEFEGSFATKLLNPEDIYRSRWSNRHELSFSGAEFEDLKRDIDEHGGNVQPIKVRHASAANGKYEVVFGHRRHQACLELGINVLALIDDLDDKHLFIEMDRENRQRKDLRPFEVGSMYAKALDEGLFSSTRKLAVEVGIDQSQLNKALALARLPNDVLKAFPSPLDLQYRWSSDLVAAIQKDPDFVLSISKTIIEEVPRPAAGEVFRRLTVVRGTVPHVPVKNESLIGATGQKGLLSFSSKKRSVRIDLENIDPARFAEVRAAIKNLLN